MTPWQQHIAGVNGILAANPVRRYQPPPMVIPDAAGQIDPSAPTPSLAAVYGGTETQAGPYAAGAGRADNGRNTQFSGLGFGPGERLPSTGMLAGAGVPGAVGRAGFSAATGLLGPVGLGLSGVNTVNNGYNAVQNYNDLGAWGVNVGAGDILSGLGGGRFGGTLADAMDASGFGSLSQQPGETGGSPEIAAEGPMAMAGDINVGGGGGFFRRGGYTGAGHDGAVQDARPAGVVHEGEFVVSAPAMRAGGAGLLHLLSQINRHGGMPMRSMTRDQEGP